MTVLLGLILLLGAVGVAILAVVLIQKGRRSQRRGKVVSGSVLLLLALPFLAASAWLIWL